MARSEIEEANKRFGDAVGRGDVASVAALYTEDATVLPPNSEMIRGRPAIEGFWKSAIDMGVRGLQLRTIEVQSSGDLAYEIGSAVLDMQAEGRASTQTAKYVVVWKRAADGSWRLAADIWNSSPS